MDDLSGAIGLVVLIDLAVLAAGSCVLVVWFRSARTSAAALGGAWAGFVAGYIVFLRWAFVPTVQIPRSILVAVVLGVSIGAAVWLAFSFIDLLFQRRPRD